MEYAFFVGCMAQTKEYTYEASTRKIIKSLGIGLVDLEGFSCCAPSCLVHGMDYVTGLALTARNLCVAEEQGLSILTLCASCFENLSITNNLLKTNEKLRKDVNGALSAAGREFKGKTKVTHIVKMLYEDVTVERLRREVSRPLKELRI